MDEIDFHAPDDRHYFKRKVDLDNRPCKMYDKIADIELQLITAKGRNQAIEALIAEIHHCEESQPNGQWLKSFRFKLPVIGQDLDL